MIPLNPNISLLDLAPVLKSRYERPSAALVPLLYEVQARDRGVELDQQTVKNQW